MWEDVINWMSVTSILVICVISLLTYLWWQSGQDIRRFRKLGIQGPEPSILIGNSRQLFKTGFFDTFSVWKKQFGNVYGISLSNQPTLVIADTELLKDLLIKKFYNFRNRMPQNFLNVKPFKYDLLRLRDDHWKHVRSILSPTFSSGKLKKMMPSIIKVAQNLVKNVRDKAEKGEEVELKHLSGSFALDTIAAAAFGMDVDSLANPDEPFLINAQNIVQLRGWLIAIFVLFPKLGKFLMHFGVHFIPTRATEFFTNIVQMALKERRQDHKAKKFNDFLQLLVDSQKESHSERGPVDAEIDFIDQLSTSKEWHTKALTDDEATANAIIFLLAGYETTSTVMSLTLFYLTANPEVLQKAQEEVDTKLGKNLVTYETASQLTYLDMCMSETMRLFPAAFILDREADQDMMLGDYQVKKGFRMMIPVCAIHRDPEYWPDPEKFDPERFTPEAKAARNPFVYMPFGSGPRNCIGMRLAQLEIRMAIASLLQHYTPVLCDKSVYPPVLKAPQLTISFKDGLWVKFKPRT